MPRTQTVLRILAALAVACLLTAPGSAAVVEPIGAGSDLFTTPGDGGTFFNFFREPLPAGFFCADSEPFAGMVTLRGVPLGASPAGSLGNTDTVVERVDDAVFDRDGMATTRVHLVALSLESIEPIRTRCGEFRLRVTPADGPQPLTTMQIFRTHRYGGFFLAPLQMNVQLTFEPLFRGGEPAVLVKQVDFPAINKDHKWAYQAAAPNGLSRPGSVVVQSGRPGSAGFLNLPGTSNFAALWGVSEAQAETGAVSLKDIKQMPAVTGHIEGGHFVAPPSVD